MHLSRSRRLAVATAALALLTSTLLVGTPAHSAPAKCTVGPQSELKVKSKYEHVYETQAVLASGRDETRRYTELEANLGTFSIWVDTCKDTKGKWHIVTGKVLPMKRSLNEITFDDKGKVTVNTKRTFGGFGHQIRRLEKDHIMVEHMVCYRGAKTKTGTIKMILDLPWPGKYYVSLGTWIAGKALSGATEKKSHCHQLGPTLSKISFTINSKGKVSLGSDKPVRQNVDRKQESPAHCSGDIRAPGIVRCYVARYNRVIVQKA